MNNFDQSSTGVNIELYIRRDYDLAGWYLDDFLNGDRAEKMVEVLRDRRGDMDHLLIFESEEEAYGYHYTQEMLDELTTCDLEDAVDMFGYNGWEEDRVNDDLEYREYLMDELKCVTRLGFQRKMHEERGRRGLEYDFTSVGFSQGDTVRVWLSEGARRKHTWITREYVDNLLWSAPVSGVLIVNGEDVYLDEHIDDPYDFSKEGMIESLRELKLPEEVYAFLEKNAPEYPY